MLTSLSDVWFPASDAYHGNVDLLNLHTGRADRSPLLTSSSTDPGSRSPPRPPNLWWSPKTLSWAAPSIRFFPLLPRSPLIQAFCLPRNNIPSPSNNPTSSLRTFSFPRVCVDPPWESEALALSASRDPSSRHRSPADLNQLAVVNLN